MYGIAGYNFSYIDVRIVEPIQIVTNPTTSGAYLGIGTTPAGGTGPMFWSFDANHVWTFSDKLQKPATLLTLGGRAGPIWRSKTDPDRNFALWGGFLYSHLNSATVGVISFDEVFDGGQIDGIQSSLDEWYNGLPDWKQTAFEDIYNRLSEGLNDVSENVENSTIRYEMDKVIGRPINLLIGGQWQINRVWQLRGELQLIGDRTMGLLSVNWRFGLPCKNLFSRQQ